MNNSKFIVGLTGGIGSGKSEVSRRFARLGIRVVDADQIAREVVEPGEPALAEICAHFGTQLLNERGELNRAQLRDIIFSNPKEKAWLESCLHPRINQRVRARLSEASSPYAILESPLLLETTQHQLVNRVLVIDTSEDSQLERASRRDQKSRAQIQAIVATQISRAERLAKAQDVIHNNGDLSELDTQVAQLHQQYLLLAAHK